MSDLKSRILLMCFSSEEAFQFTVGSRSLYGIFRVSFTRSVVFLLSGRTTSPLSAKEISFNFSLWICHYQHTQGSLQITSSSHLEPLIDKNKQVNKTQQQQQSHNKCSNALPIDRNCCHDTEQNGPRSPLRHSHPCKGLRGSITSSYAAYQWNWVTLISPSEAIASLLAIQICCHH